MQYWSRDIYRIFITSHNICEFKAYAYLDSPGRHPLVASFDRTKCKQWVVITGSYPGTLNGKHPVLK